MVKAGAAATLGMVLHELATNAAKYGSLSVPDGCIDIRWQVAAEKGHDVVSISWKERNGPIVKTPEHTGFGTGFIQRSVEYELEGRFEWAYPATGFQCTLVFPAHLIVK